MKHSDTLNELGPALAKAQAEISVAIKGSTNPHFRSKYADLGAIWDACRPALTKHGLSVVQLPADSNEPGRVAMETMLLHSSGQFITGHVSTRLTKDDAQGVGSAITYLRRYALAAMVGVVADEDDDGNAASQQPQRQQQQAASYDEANDEIPTCPIHKREMKPGKTGGWFCPTKDDAGNWCKQQIKAS